MKKKIIIIAAIVAAVVLIAAGITTAVVLNNGYLDSLKDYDVASERSYNGVEVLEKDGLYYLTRDGKKLSKTGYSLLMSLNDFYEDAEDAANFDDFELYTWYIARKPDANEWLFVNADGDEKKVVGENLEIESIYLPYVVFYNTATYEQCFVSAKQLSASTETELSREMYNGVEFLNINEGVQTDFLIAYTRSNGTTDTKYVYFDVNGTKLFESPISPAAKYELKDSETKLTTCYFGTSLKELYNMKGELVAKDIELGEVENNILMLMCKPNDSTLSEAENIKKSYIQIVSLKTTFKLGYEYYDFTTAETVDNLLYIATKNTAGATTSEGMLFNMVTGDSVACKNGIRAMNGGIVAVANADRTAYTYIDAKTGMSLLTSKYGDMTLYTNSSDAKVLCSATELAQRTANITDTLLKPVAYLHFVAPGAQAVELALGATERLNIAVDSATMPVYFISTLTNVSNAAEPYSITKNTVYAPFASTSVKSAGYDKLQYLDLFADGFGVVLATDFDAGKLDFIDVTTGNIVKTVSAAGAEMAKISFEHEGTYTIKKDSTVKESMVELAVIVMSKKNDMGEQESTEWTVFERNTPMKDDDELATAAVTVVEIGKNLTTPYSYIVSATDAHLVVHNTARSSTVYALNDEYVLEKVASVPYNVLTINYFDSADLSKMYITVIDDHGDCGLYTSTGEQILAVVYDHIDVEDENYFTAYDRYAYGAFKYNPKKNKVKQIIDFIYDDMTYVGDGGFIAIKHGEAYLFDEGKQVKSDCISEDCDIFENWVVNEETGKLEVSENFVCNVNGKLYIHRGEKLSEAVRTEYYDYDEIYGQGSDNKMPYNELVDIADTGVKVVYFRNTDGSVIETKVVYPTVKGAIDFKMTDVWYTTPPKELQGVDTVISEVTIEAESRSKIFNVYKPHSVANIGA